MIDANDTVTGELFSESKKNRFVVGLAGPAGAGKDTVAGILRSKTGCETYAFAGPLKEALKILGIHEPTSREAKEALLPGRTYSYRTAAQRLGTEFARGLDPNFWQDLAEKCTKGAHAIVFTDVRFENEAQWIRNQGGVIWHIKGRKTTVTGNNALHASENPLAISEIDRVIHNDSSIEKLEAWVSTLLKE
jgi:hypothetical protein